MSSQILDDRSKTFDPFDGDERTIRRMIASGENLKHFKHVSLSHGREWLTAIENEQRVGNAFDTHPEA